MMAGLGSLVWGMNLLIFGESLYNYNYLSACGSPTQGYGLDFVPPPILSHCGFFFISVVVEGIFY